MGLPDQIESGGRAHRGKIQFRTHGYPRLRMDFWIAWICKGSTEPMHILGINIESSLGSTHRNRINGPTPYSASGGFPGELRGFRVNRGVSGWFTNQNAHIHDGCVGFRKKAYYFNV